LLTFLSQFIEAPILSKFLNFMLFVKLVVSNLHHFRYNVCSSMWMMVKYLLH